MNAERDRSIRVLHVEDDPEFADLAATFLERENTDFDVETAEGAAAGLAALDDREFDCVVSDYDMPEADGLAFLEAVRERHGDLPFVLFTGKGSEEIASEAIAAGVTDYLQKGGSTDRYAVLANRIENAVQRHRTEHELERTRRRYELIGRASADAFWDWDIETGEMERSEGYTRIFGFDPEEVGDHGDWWIEQLHPDDRERVEAAVDDALAGDDDSLEIEYRVETPDGTYRDAYTRARIVRDETGEPVRMVGAVTDVTDLRRRERQLADMRDRLELVLEETDTGVWEWDPATDTVTWDATVERLFGLAPGTFEGTFEAFRRRIYEEDRERVLAAIEASMANDEYYDIDYRIQRDDGGVRWVRAQGVSRRAAATTDERFVGLITDVTEQKARQRELEQYETVLETVPDGVFVLNDDETVVGGNELASAMLGFQREELIGQWFGDLVEAGVVEEAIIDRYTDAVRRLLSDESADEQAEFAFEATVHGEPRIFEARIALRPSEDEFAGTIGVIRDVTERREREAHLRRSERRFEAIFDDPSAFIGLLAPDGSMLLANETALEFIGADLDDVVGEPFVETPWWDGASPEERAAVETAVERAAAGEFERFEGRHVGVDDRTIWVEGQIRPVVDDTDEVVSLLVEAIDVTDRFEHERRIEGLHETTRELVRADDRASVASIVADATADILGFPSNVVRMRRDGQLTPVAISSAARAELGDRPVYAVDEGKPGEALSRGEPILLTDADGEGHRSRLYVPIGEYGTLTIGDEAADALDGSDIAVARVLANNAAVALDRIEGEQRLRRREQDLRRQNERLDRFASMLSHDLRNPLNVAIGHLDLLGDGEHVDRVERALGRMNDIVDDVLALARQGEQVVDPDVVDLTLTVRAAWDTVDAPEATLDVADGLGTLRADGSRLQQLVENVFANAVEHAGPSVTVRVGRLGDAGFYVEDDGPGIPPEEREAVFEFGHTTAAEGTGMGLAIVEEIADAHGWSVAATDGERGGARIEVRDVEWDEA